MIQDSQCDWSKKGKHFFKEKQLALQDTVLKRRRME
jgi:hypothetical protein